MVCGLCSVLSLVIGMCVCVDSLLFLFRVCSLNVVMVVGLYGMIRHTEIAIIRVIIIIKFLAPIMMLTILVVMMKMLMTMVMTILPKKDDK